MKNRSIQGKNIFITGASGGLGAEIARACARSGANLFLFARSVQTLEDLKADLQASFSVKIHVYKLDVSNTDEVTHVFREAILVAKRIDVLVNNAGYGVFRAADEASISEIKGMFNVNVIGLMATTSIVLPNMKAQRTGHIINIASQAGKIATPKSSIYAATKHAVLGYSNSLRMELEDFGVYVTTVNPGPISTGFFDIADVSGTYVKNVSRYMLKPDEVAKKVVSVMLRKKREINLPRWMNAGSIIYALFPSLFERLGKRSFNKK